MISAKSKALIATIVVLSLLPASIASADFGIAKFDGAVSANEAGDPYTQAGGHPYSGHTETFLNTHPDPFLGLEMPFESTRDIVVDLPPGFVGNPFATPTRCTASELLDRGPVACPISSQVGVVTLGIYGSFDTVPLYNMATADDIPAALAFNYLGAPIYLRASVRPGDHGLTLSTLNIANAIPLVSVKVVAWGVPADPIHDPQRYNPDPETPSFGIGTDAPRLAFLTNPTRCTPPGVGLETKNRVRSWENPQHFEHASFFSHLPPPEEATQVGPTGCADVPFEPRLSIEPTSRAADSPTGLDIELDVPQQGLTAPGALASAHLKRVEVTLPEGMAVNPSAANGLGTCAPAQIGLANDRLAACPDSSKIGTVEIDTPLLADPMPGAVYLAKQGDNPFGSLLALYLAVESSGIVIKLPGRVATDPRTGRLTASFDDNPQLPFETLRLRLWGGDRATLINPPSCGPHSYVGTLVPWSAQDPSRPTPAEIVTEAGSLRMLTGPNGRPCPDGGLEAKLSAGTSNPVAGAYSPFGLRLTREDGSQRFRAVAASLPEGLLAKLAGVPYCPEAKLAAIPTATGTAAAELAAPSCPTASQVGSLSVGAGAGPSPLFVDTGKVYLAGPYKGSPLSLVFVTPALAGPFDLGNVSVRTALRVDSRTTRVTAISDSLPLILGGIPLDLRDLRVNLDRPEFVLNPTDCDPARIEATVTGAAGATKALAERFRVGDCGRLGFKPKLSVRLQGGTKRGQYPRLRAVLQAKRGQANIERVSVALPRSEFLAQNHIRTICTRVQFAADNCPKASVYGMARAVSPLLDKPLEGPVYLRSSSNPLPDMVVALNGQIDVDLTGRIDSVNGGIRTTFASVPDAPVSRFVLRMRGGRKSLLENSRDLCASANRATVRMDGQNGKTHATRPPVTSAGCGKSREKD